MSPDSSPDPQCVLETAFGHLSHLYREKPTMSLGSKDFSAPCKMACKHMCGVDLSTKLWTYVLVSHIWFSRWGIVSETFFWDTAENPFSLLTGEVMHRHEWSEWSPRWMHSCVGGKRRRNMLLDDDIQVQEQMATVALIEASLTHAHTHTHTHIRNTKLSSCGLRTATRKCTYISSGYVCARRAIYSTTGSPIDNQITQTKHESCLCSSFWQPDCVVQVISFARMKLFVMLPKVSAKAFDWALVTVAMLRRFQNIMLLAFDVAVTRYNASENIHNDNNNNIMKNKKTEEESY